MATYKIDPMHSEITFKVKHLMITNVTGSFQQFDATMESNEDDFSDATISFEADVNSISTNNEQRDGHLKGADFFAADEFPKLQFSSTSSLTTTPPASVTALQVKPKSLRLILPVISKPALFCP